MKLFLSVALFYFFVSGTTALVFQDCGSKVGNFTKIQVSGCDTTKSVCVLTRNTNATISIDFDLREGNAKEVTAVVHGVILHIDMPFPLENPNGCLNSGLVCPLAESKHYEYVATLAVLKSYPKVRVDVKWELKNEDKENIVCVLIPAKIE